MIMIFNLLTPVISYLPDNQPNTQPKYYRFYTILFRLMIMINDDEYQRMHHFKSRVLETAITQINEHTDIKATYEQHKKGRTITGFSFKFKQKVQPKIETKRDPTP